MLLRLHMDMLLCEHMLRLWSLRMLGLALHVSLLLLLAEIDPWFLVAPRRGFVLASLLLLLFEGTAFSG